MRTELTFKALSRDSKRYLLCRKAATATRRLHRPNTRIQETMNDALEYLSGSKPTVATALPNPASVQLRRAA